jgi:hypothetical protein
LAVTSSTSGGRSVGIVRLRTKSHRVVAVVVVVVVVVEDPKYFSIIIVNIMD